MISHAVEISITRGVAETEDGSLFITTSLFDILYKQGKSPIKYI